MEWKGIDVSKHNGAIDWAKVAAAGVQFAMVRVGIGSRKNTPTLDDCFVKNVQGALSARIPVGAYLYSYALDAAAARQEAEFVLRQIAPFAGKMAYPIVYDIEDSSQANLGKAALTAMCSAFCSAVEGAGWRAAIYANLDWVKNKLDMGTLSRYDLWLAQWGNKPTYSGDIALWQYSDKGNVGGISSSVDMNVCYVDYPEMVRRVGLNGFAAAGGGAAAPATEQPVEAPPAAPATPTLKIGSEGEAVERMQKLLLKAGVFDSATEAAVKEFQKSHGLTADGIVGPKTWAALMG